MSDLEVRWKTESCNVGDDCWCRLIVPESPEDKDDYIIGGGCVGKEVAEHIVKIHNESLNKK